MIILLMKEGKKMKVYKKELPAGVRKMFTTEKGVKVKIVNSLYTKNKKKKNNSKKRKKK